MDLDDVFIELIDRADTALENENEINAKIDVIEGRLCIVQINNNKGEKEEGND